MDNNKTRYYEILGIAPTSNREEIAEGYRQLALQNHPMRCAREEEASAFKRFTKISEAYEVLCDPLMKRIYDKFGEYSLKHGVQKGTDRFPGYVNQGRHFKIFEKFFGTSNPYIENPSAGPVGGTELDNINKANRPDNIEVQLECELYEFYNGALKEVSIARKQMLSETQGSVVSADRFNVIVLPGFNAETRLVYPGKGHEAFAAHCSDLVVRFAQKPMQNYERRGDDIIYTHTLTLIEALQMQPVAVNTLDNRKVFVAPTEVVTPQTELRVAGEGMPKAVSGDIVADTTTQTLPSA
mmetsp:Transcript_31285/g.38692  ORF Transcript_31285/g.38692 Transcript_31285/m.38692 type:complete len:297 (+) Transcript_31285:28-918(+)